MQHLWLDDGRGFRRPFSRGPDQSSSDLLIICMTIVCLNFDGLFIDLLRFLEFIR
jgi:hypothetical protein